MATLSIPSLLRLRDVSHSDRVSTYAEIAARIDACRRALADIGLTIKPNSALSQLFAKADRLNRAWIAQDDSEDVLTLCATDEAAWIADAILGAIDERGSHQAIRRIAKSDMRLSQRHSSQGKDALWELSLREFLRLRGVTTTFKDPPDLEIPLPDMLGDVGIACKKVYSEESVEKQFSKGLAQLKPYSGVGMVAFNLDDLIPGGRILRVENAEEGMSMLHSFNLAFIDRHRSYFQKAVKDGRCLGVWAATTMQMDVADQPTRFSRATQHDLWTLTDANIAARIRTSELARLINAAD
ncbi:hypothetical protein ACN9M1_10890 [Ralstonia sp. R-29]|uniref:hypothetical protein n=1 Tax=Ralstonia sp. R-29 TaxID=3404059 RepID=UPI003CF1A3BA